MAWKVAIKDNIRIARHRAQEKSVKAVHRVDEAITKVKDKIRHESTVDLKASTHRAKEKQMEMVHRQTEVRKLRDDTSPAFTDQKQRVRFWQSYFM